MKHGSWIVATIFTFIAAACGRYEAPPSDGREGPINLGKSAPAFTLESAEGEPVSLSDYAGKPVLLYFSMGPG
jgi:cytochrome oxidase Cu insertion factor (SCO1/SenC/PrrC family)